jgi:hypothetical protein
MNAGGQQPINATLPIHALSEIISPLRLGTYLNAAGHDAERALLLYLWNAKVGAAFHIPIQSVEVGLRNRVSDGLAALYGPEWWRDQAFLALAEPKRADDIEVVRRRLISKRMPVATGQMIAGLSFGFWVAMLHGRYNPDIWSGHLRTAFPHLPSHVERHWLHSGVREISDFRNRIWHHEPIFRRNLSRDFSRCLMVLGWLCPTKATWIKPHCRVPALLREKP